MNRLNRLAWSLAAALALAAYLAVPALADDGSDTQEITINANDIALIDEKAINSTGNTSGDESDGVTFTFEDGSGGNFITAGNETSQTVQKDALLAWSVNYNAKITVCTQGQFNHFGQSSNSKSYLKIRANDAALAEGSASGWVTLWDDAGGIDCGVSEDLITGLVPSFDPGEDDTNPELTYEAVYDIEDGNFSGDTLTTERTIVSQ